MLTQLLSLSFLSFRFSNPLTTAAYTTNTLTPEGGDLTLETKSDSNSKKNVVSWLKTVFPSQEDANSFLKIQIDKMQESQQSAPTSPNVTSTSSPSASAFTSPKELQSEAKLTEDKPT